MTTKIRSILFVSHEYGIGGATKSLISLVKGINQIYPDIKCKVCVPWKYGRHNLAYRLFIENGIDCKKVIYRHDWKKKDSYYSIKLFIYDIVNFFAIKKMSRLIDKEECSIVCSNSTAVCVGGAASVINGTPHIQIVREMMEEDFGIEYRNRGLMKEVFEESKGVVFISSFVRNKYNSLFRIQNSEIIHVGIKTEEYYCEKRQLFTEKTIRILQVGAFKDGKGTKDTIRIIKGLKDDGINNVSLVLVGGGERKYIKEMWELIDKYELEDRIQIVDFVSNIKEYMIKADVFIMNSVAEGFGRVTVEAMLAGCLVLGRNAGGTKEIIIDNYTGILFDDENDAIMQIKKIINDSIKYVGIAKNGQKYANENYSEISTSREFIRFCSQVVCSRR